MSDPIVGIDLGTSNTVVAHASAAGNVTVLADDAGYKIHPSVVSFHPNGGVVVGAAAKQRKVIDPQNTVYSVKRLIGRAYQSPEVQTAKARSPFLIKEGPSNAPVIATRGGTFAVPEISAIVLDHVRNIAAARLERPVERAVVTVPASFNDAQRSATATAGAIAGLTVVRVLNEPTAAALAYGHSRHLREIIAVYDFGGGTFDITFLRLEDQVYEVLGTSGDTFLGGDDLDERLVEKMVAKFLAENRIDLRGNEVSMMRLRAVAEQTKIELSRRARAVVRIDEIAYGPRGAPLNLQIEITRDEFVREIADLVDRTFPVCSEALALANLSVDRISDVILVGGTTKIPYVRDQVSKFFGKAPRTDINPEDAVAAGAALQATSLERILAPRPTSKQPVPPRAAPDEETTARPTDLLQLDDPESGATMAPSELTVSGPGPERNKRTTASYSDGARPPTESTQPDTRYSVSRSGVHDVVEGADRFPVAPLSEPPFPAPLPMDPLLGFENTPPPGTQTQLLGRVARPTPGAPAQNRTVFGVPAAPSEIDVELGSAGSPAPSRDDSRAERPITATGTASPPPVPRPNPRPAASRPPPMPPMPQVIPPMPPMPPQVIAPLPPMPPMPPQVTAPLPAMRRPPDPRPQPGATGPPPISSWLDSPQLPDRRAADSAAETRPEAWVARNPATTQPMAPTTPIAPPTAPTMIAAIPDPAAASTARGMGAQSRLAAEPSPATTAKGFPPPQGYPVQPPIQSPAYPVQPTYVPPPASPPQSYPIEPTYALPPASPPQSYPVQPAYVPPPVRVPAPPPAPPVLLEVAPRGLGIATVAGFCEELIRRNARLPAEARKLFTTSRDHQDMVRIVVCQGESRRLDRNTVIGDLVLQNLPPRPRGETSIEVTFEVDASGVLQVRALDAETGAEQRATLALVGGVAQEDVAASRDRLQQLRR